MKDRGSSSVQGNFARSFYTHAAPSGLFAGNPSRLRRTCYEKGGYLAEKPGKIAQGLAFRSFNLYLWLSSIQPHPMNTLSLHLIFTCAMVLLGWG